MPTPSQTQGIFRLPLRCLTAVVVALLILIAPESITHGANPPPADAPVFSAATLFHDQVSVIEADLATLLQRRLDAAGPELAIIDYQVDLRLLERWMLSKAADPKTTDEFQAVIALRVANLQSAGEQTAQRLQNSGKALLPTQLDGMAKLHELTYKLPPIKTLGALDETCRAVATDLILAANPAPAEVNNLPPMRPKSTQDSAPQTAPAPRSLADLNARAKEVQVSPALKRQLVALGAAAEAAASGAKDDKGQEESAALYDALSEVMDLSDGLERNVGIDAAARPKVEQQLTEGLALFTDPRTRSSGSQRIAALSQYRATLIHIQHLHVPNAMQPKIAPVFIWVNNNPDSAAPVLNSIEKYLQLCNRVDGSNDAGGLTPIQRKTLDSLQKQFIAQRNSFLEDAGNLGNKVGFLSATPANLVDHVDTMSQLLDSIESIEKLPRAIQVLMSLHPKPAGALEKRQALAFADLNSAVTTPTRDASMQFIADAEHLAQLADIPAPPAGISAAILKAYTHDRLTQVQARRAMLLSGLASQVAVGKPMDSADVAKLQILHDLMDSLALANDVEACLAKSEQLTRWADWSITPPQIGALVSPYRDATASAFDGFADDNATPLFRWPDLHKRYMPILMLARDAGSYADQCAAFPTGLPGEFARLLTPMENQPFATERNASLAVYLWQASATLNDQKLTDGMFEAMLATLKKAFGG